MMMGSENADPMPAISAPGFIQIPVCKLETVVWNWLTFEAAAGGDEKCDHYPCCDVEPF